MLRNTSDNYGLVAIVLHWLAAAVVMGMFGLGIWMVDLSYYDDWYKRGPDIHRSIGILLFALMLFRWVWRSINPVPQPLDLSAHAQNQAAHAVHLILYVALFVIMVTGYLISTAEGDSIDVFNWFSVPALLAGGKTQADTAGDIHFYLACAVMGLATLHALAALHHHFKKRDRTLIRMLKP